jgi:tripartite-type tricarboxylate transporter receptor subunit TctC
MHVFCLTILVIVALGLNCGAALAQGYPNKPVRIIVPFAPGGAVDELARLIGAKLGSAFNQPVIVESRAGAGGIIGADAVAKSPPDGYTILQNTNGQAISPALYRKLPYDVVTDFIPVTQLVASTLILVASPKLPVTSTRELIALAKSEPGKLNYGSSGVGNPLHLTMEMFKGAAGIDIQPIPYRSDAQINAALLAGDVQVAVVPLATSRPLIEAGSLRALGIAGARRSAVLPEVPTIAEGGLPGFESSSWQGLFLPAKAPPDVVELIARETTNALKAPDVRERLKAMAYEPVGSTPEEFASYFKSELAKFARVVKDAQIPPQD